jgi:hypothetical protein
MSGGETGHRTDSLARIGISDHDRGHRQAFAVQLRLYLYASSLEVCKGKAKLFKQRRTLHTKITFPKFRLSHFDEISNPFLDESPVTNQPLGGGSLLDENFGGVAFFMFDRCVKCFVI